MTKPKPLSREIAKEHFTTLCVYYLCLEERIVKLEKAQKASKQRRTNARKVLDV